MQAQDIRDRALRVIAYGSTKMMQEFLAEIDPDGYYPEATKRNGLWVHIARVMCTKELDRRELPCKCHGKGWYYEWEGIPDGCGSYSGAHMVEVLCGCAREQERDEPDIFDPRDVAILGGDPSL